MTELQLGLLGIGALVILGVLVYNKLQELKLRRQGKEAFGGEHEDVLLASSPGEKEQTRSDERIEPTFSAPLSDATAARGHLDGGIDFIVELETQGEVSGESVSAAIGETATGCTRTVGWEGYNPQAAQWELLDPAGRYRRVRAGLQLADRRGAAGEQDLKAFGELVAGVAEALGAVPAPEDVQAALARARALDQLCADVDVQIALNLLARGGPASGTRIRAYAESQGLVLERDGRYCRRDDAGLELYSLCTLDGPAFSTETMKTFSTGGLSLQFDVARAPGGIHTFDRFVEFARGLADRIGADIVDDNRRPLDSTALGKIRAQLQALYASMDHQGIPAGGALALRLFA